jgi:hypothetical protein
MTLHVVPDIPDPEQARYAQAVDAWVADEHLDIAPGLVMVSNDTATLVAQGEVDTAVLQDTVHNSDAASRAEAAIMFSQRYTTIASGLLLRDTLAKSMELAGPAVSREEITAGFRQLPYREQLLCLRALQGVARPGSIG